MTFSVYLLTMCPTIYWEDSAAFSAVHSVLGIPHSPGFPMYVIWGNIFTLFPIKNSAFRSNLMSAFWGSLSLVILYFLMHSLRQGFNPSGRAFPSTSRLRRETKCRASPCPNLKKKPNSYISQLPIITGVAFLGFSSAFWLQAIRAEVYTLNVFFTLLLILLLIKWSQEKDKQYCFKILILFSFILGLSLTNHPLLMAALLPAFFVFLLTRDFRHTLVRGALTPNLNWSGVREPPTNTMARDFRWGRDSTLPFSLSPLGRRQSEPSGRSFAPTGRLWDLKKMILLLAFFLLGISLYLFLPIRSNLAPAINWGKPDNWSNFFAYITRSSQSTSITTSSNVPYLNRFLFNLSFPVIQFSLGFFWLGVIGAYVMFKESKRFFIFAFSLFIFNLLTATWATDFSLRNYDLLGYLLPSLSIFAIWFAMGLSFFCESILKVGRVARQKTRNPTYIFKVSFYGLILLLPIYQMSRNFDQCNKRANVWAYQYADQILNSVKKDALILVRDDNTLTTLWYLNYAEKKRPDVKIISSSALSQKSYQDQLREQYQEVRLPKIKLENSQKIASDLCQLNIDKMPIYCQYYTSDTVFAHHLLPAGYIFEYHPERVTLSNSDIQRQKEFLENNFKNKRFDPITKEHFGNLVFNIGVFYNQLGISTISLEYLLMALDIDPSNSRIYAQLGKAFLKMGKLSKAKEFFQAALELDPYNQDLKKALENI